MKCPNCGLMSVSRVECHHCGVIFAKFQYDIPTAPDYDRREETEAEAIAPKSTSSYVHLGLPLVAFLIAGFLGKVFPRLTWAFSMWIHEFGHAFAGWWGGFASTPFLGWTNMAANPSWIVTFCFTFLLGLLAFKSFEKKCYFLTISFALMFLVQMYFRFILSKQELDAMFSFMGVGGEFWISTWLVVAYHHDFPEYTHWKYLRFPLLFVGAFVFINAFDLWWDISLKRAEIPWGSLWGGPDHGDMNSLLFEHGWSPNMMTRRYLGLGKFCLAVMILHYVSIVSYGFFQKRNL